MKKISYIYLFISLALTSQLFAIEQDSTVSVVPDTISAAEALMDVLPDSVAADTLMGDAVVPDSSRLDTLAAHKPVEIDSSQLPVDIPVVRAHVADTLLYRGLDYGSFGDVFDWMPGTYNADLGNVGNHSRGAMFAGIPGEFDLMYGFLNLNDPYTGLADMNWVPVEGVGSVEHVTSHAQRDQGYTDLGQTLQVSPLDISALPPRSTVTYRTGNSSYSDVDVRLGIWANPKMTINMGGILKQYVGLLNYNRYDGQKINLEVHRKLFQKFEMDYIYLQNKSELDVPVTQYIEDSELSSPHETIKRSDHGLALRYGRLFTSTFQYTKYRNDYYEMDYGDYTYYSSREVENYRFSGQLRKKLMGVELQTGFLYSLKELHIQNWGYHKRARTDSWVQVALNRESITASAGLRSSYLDAIGKDYVLPEVSVTWRPVANLTGFAWSNKMVRSPSLAYLFSTSPFYVSNSGLNPTELQQTAAGVEYSWRGISAYLSASTMDIQNQCAVYADEDTAFAMNQINHNRYSIDAALSLDWKYGLSAHAKGKYLWASADDPYFDITNYPAGYGKGYVQYHNIFFQKDMDLTLRLGGTLLGEMYTPVYYYAQYPLSTWITDPIIVPYVHVIMKVRTMTFFFSYHNPLDAEYQRVFSYPMPQSEFRWGFNWMFFD